MPGSDLLKFSFNEGLVHRSILKPLELLGATSGLP